MYTIHYLIDEVGREVSRLDERLHLEAEVMEIETILSAAVADGRHHGRDFHIQSIAYDEDDRPVQEVE